MFLKLNLLNIKFPKKILNENRQRVYSPLKQCKNPFYFLVHNQRKEIKTQFPLDSLSPNNICQGFPRASNSSSFGKLVFPLCAAKFHRSGKKGIFQRNPKSAFFPPTMVVLLGEVHSCPSNGQ